MTDLAYKICMAILITCASVAWLAILTKGMS